MDALTAGEGLLRGQPRVGCRSTRFSTPAAWCWRTWSRKLG